MAVKVLSQGFSSHQQAVTKSCRSELVLVWVDAITAATERVMREFAEQGLREACLAGRAANDRSLPKVEPFLGKLCTRTVGPLSALSHRTIFA